MTRVQWIAPLRKKVFGSNLSLEIILSDIFIYFQRNDLGNFQNLILELEIQTLSRLRFTQANFYVLPI